MRLLAGFLTALLLIAPGQPLLAADSAAIRRAVDEFLRNQINSLPGKATLVVGAIDADRLAGVCERFDVSMENGAPRWGKTRVIVSCRGGTWMLRVQVQIRLEAEYLVTTRPISAGQKLTDTDVRGQLGELPNEVLTDKEQAIGRVAKVSLAAGRPLRADMFRQPWIVQQNQTVKIVITGPGFQVTKDGRARTNAAVGQVTQVQLNSGEILSGEVRSDGTVEIRN